MIKIPAIQQFSQEVLTDHAIMIGFIPERYSRLLHKDNEKFWIRITAHFNRVDIMYRLTKWYHMDMPAVEFMALREQDAQELSQYFYNSEQTAVQLKKDLQAMTNQSKKDVREYLKKRYKDLTVRGIH